MILTASLLRSLHTNILFQCAVSFLMQYNQFPLILSQISFSLHPPTKSVNIRAQLFYTMQCHFISSPCTQNTKQVISLHRCVRTAVPSPGTTGWSAALCLSPAGQGSTPVFHSSENPNKEMGKALGKGRRT